LLQFNKSVVAQDNTLTYHDLRLAACHPLSDVLKLFLTEGDDPS
jgi:hypothetical protein